ncbi:hypothetical protein PR202_ga05848 [Eleusine coracana subsp. coracana]|uniref:TFIIB-type domain-containing protein n=1 Tax=Eleusine coracana subsp. coracana TaxID=191504 RepID=A0AAV5BTI5_ELECO|nr:hypothetical protein PR202_ga05848 [Eleusine coracana subsp. coracana]
MHGATETFCPDCRRATEVILDHSTGDTICTECALVLEAHYIDEGSEWRNFADDGGGEDRDPSRAKDGGAALPRMRIVVGEPDPESTLVEAFHGIADMAERLGLVATIRDRAKEVYKRMDEARQCPRGKKRDVFYAACLYVACRNEGKPRTYKELATATCAGPAAKKDIGKLTTVIKKEMRAAEEATRRLEDGLDVRRNPESIAAAISYMVVQRAGAKRTVRGTWPWPPASPREPSRRRTRTSSRTPSSSSAKTGLHLAASCLRARHRVPHSLVLAACLRHVRVPSNNSYHGRVIQLELRF